MIKLFKDALDNGANPYLVAFLLGNAVGFFILAFILLLKMIGG